NKSLRQVQADLKAMEQLVASRKTDLLAKIPHGDGQTILREALLLADHNGYHVGQVVLLRRLLGAWGKRN
ncbi:MAG TPA: DinB family protein, partial [Bryobacteraceae bacterium]